MTANEIPLFFSSGIPIRSVISFNQKKFSPNKLGILVESSKSWGLPFASVIVPV
jgi:hypothetical protein